MLENEFEKGLDAIYVKMTIKKEITIQMDENMLKRMHYGNPIPQNYLFINLKIL